MAKTYFLNAMSLLSAECGV